MKFYKKYNINDLGISSTIYLTRHIESYLVAKGFEVVVKGDIIRFRRRVGFINVRGDLFHGVLVYVDIINDEMIIKLKYFTLSKILTIFFLFCIPTVLLLSPLLTYPQPWIFAFIFFFIAAGNGIQWLIRYLDLRGIFREINDVVRALK